MTAVQQSLWPARFMSHVAFEPMSGCWLWTGGTTRSGYGVYGKPQTTAHRVSYELHVGPIPSGHDMDHLCRNRACVNPDHLEPVSHHENMRRSFLARNGEIKSDRCGTWNRYQAGCPCPACVEAWRDYDRARRGWSPRPLAPCGSVGGATRHRRAGEPLCSECRSALNAYYRDRKRRKKAAA